MASVMQMRWNGVTKEQYDELRPVVQWETERRCRHQRDRRLGIAGPLRPLLRRTVWRVQQVGIAGQPDVTWHDAHAIYNPQAVKAGAPA
jgi:hypothetical protein